MLDGYWTVRVRVVVRVAPEAEAVIVSVEVPAGVPVTTVGDVFVQAIAVMAKRIAIKNVRTGDFILVGRHQRHAVDRSISASIKASWISAVGALASFESLPWNCSEASAKASARLSAEVSAHGWERVT